jgi:hypothetical protein
VEFRGNLRKFEDFVEIWGFCRILRKIVESLKKFDDLGIFVEYCEILEI